jgi:hypothetical protein
MQLAEFFFFANASKAAILLKHPNRRSIILVFSGL